MFHPALPPQPPPNLVSSKPVSDLAATAVIQVKNDQQKLIIDGKNPQDQYQSTTNPSNDSPLSQLEKSGGEFSIIQGQKRKIIYNIAGQQVLIETSTPPVEKNYVNLQESAGKVDLLVGEKTPSLPVQNLIEFKLRNPQDQSKPGNLQVPPLPQISEAEKISPQKTRIVEVIADRQEYDQERRIVTAEGNVVVRFDGAVIDADTLRINLDNLIAVGEGNVALTRGNQIFQGQRFTYNFIQDSGDLENGKGELYIPTTATDFAFSPSLPTDITAGGVPSRPLSYRLRANQPLTGVNSPGGIEFGASGQSDARNVSVPKSGGVLKRLRFEAQYIEFYPRGFQAQDVRITNDPFSPPELEIRATKVTVTREAPLIDRVTTQGQKLVFDQKVVVPIPVNSRKIDRRPRQVNPTIVSVGFDNGKRGGLFIERAFEPINNDQTRWTITPQFYVQRAIENGGNVANLFGVNTKLNAVLSPKTVVEGTGELTSFDFDRVEDTLRGSLRLRQSLGNVNPYTLSLESSYRDRLYNGSLGYQTVQSSIGGIITSPILPLGKSGINLSYQGGAQYINSNTDRQDLLSPLRKNDRISLGRFQGSVSLSSGIKLWEGKPLPATAKEGLKYTSNPVVPYLQAIAGITGTTSYYSSGDNQSTVTGTIGLIGQIGHFSRPFLDYTGFNVSYSQGTNSGLSPFLFDRSVDNKVLSGGISQQVYGPIRLGLQTSVNLDTSKEISTDYTLEYSRRTYGITLRYNPVLQLGGFSIRISDFNWTGGTDPFANGQVKPVVGGVVREEN
jgi:lipopolysaccharide export system protein LptA